MMKARQLMVTLVACGLLVSCEGNKSENTDNSAKSEASAEKDGAKTATSIPYDASKARDMMKSLEKEPGKAGDVIPKLVSMGPDAVKAAKFHVMDLAAKAKSMEEQGDKGAADAAEKAAVLLVNGVLKSDGSHLEDIAKNAEVERPMIRAAVCAALKGLGKDCPAKG